MPTPDDPAEDELRELVDWLAAPEAEMICDDLRDLKIPAVMQRQTGVTIDPKSGEKHTIEYDQFQILVPEAFREIANEVLDVTHLSSEGSASTEDILADLADEELVATETPRSDRERRARRLGGPAVRLMFLVWGIAAIVVIWTLIAKMNR